MTSQLALLAYRPFLDPLDLHEVWWLLLLPMAFFTAMAYKAVRAPDLARYWRQTLLFTLQIIGGIAGLYLAGLVFLNLVLPVIV